MRMTVGKEVADAILVDLDQVARLEPSACIGEPGVRS